MGGKTNGGANKLPSLKRRHLVSGRLHLSRSDSFGYVGGKVSAFGPKNCTDSYVRLCQPILAKNTLPIPRIHVVLEATGRPSKLCPDKGYDL